MGTYSTSNSPPEPPSEPTVIIRLKDQLFGSIWRTIRTLTGAAAIAVVSAWAVSFAGPSSHGNTDLKRELAARVVRYPGTHVYSAAQLASSLPGWVGAGEEPHFVGFCIGQPVPSLLHPGHQDERWLIRAGGTLIPAGYLKIGLSWNATPMACPDERHPRFLDLAASRQPNLTVSPDGHTLRAVVADATTVGFAIYEQARDPWHALPLQYRSRSGFAVRARGSRQGVAIAVVCWALNVPAQHKDDGSWNFVSDMTPLNAKSQPLVPSAYGDIERGAKAACSNAYRMPPPSRPSKPSTDAPSPAAPTSTTTTPQPPNTQPLPPPSNTTPQPPHANKSKTSQAKSQTGPEEEEDYYPKK
jgi:hypothetical protein